MKTPHVFFCIFILLSGKLLIGQIVLPWSEGFENVAPATSFNTDKDSINGLYDWSYNSTSPSRLRFSAGAGFYNSGSHAATLDLATDWTSTTHSITVQLDLSLYRNSTDLVLSFYYMDHADGSDPDDCVKIKTGSSSEYKIYNLNPGSKTDGVWNYVEIDLDQVLSSNGLYPHKETYIVFSQTGKKRALATNAEGGITFDDISITGSMPQVLLPWIEDFEGIKDEMSITSNRTSINGRGNISFQKTLNGRLRFNAGTEFCNSGSRAATLDCDAYNSSLPQNMMIMTLNMSRYVDYEDLELSFFYMHHGEEPHTFDNVYIRGSSSDTWILAYDLYANQAAAGTWKEASGIDIDALISGAGQTITSTFQIAFSQQDDYPTSTTTGQDGISIDDVKITCMDLYWCGTLSDNFNEPLNWWPNTVPNSFFDDYNVIVCGDSENNLVIELNSGNIYNASFDVRSLTIESGASFLTNIPAGQHLSYVPHILIYNDLIINGTFKSNSYPALDLTKVYVHGDLIINGNFGYNISYVDLYGNLNNNGEFGGARSGITFRGADMSVISGTKTTHFTNLTINKSNTAFNAVELTCDTDSIVCEYLYVEDGSFEINSNSVVCLDRLVIAENACLNVNDPNVKLLIRERFRNYNTTCSSTIGLPSNINNTIYFDFKPGANAISQGEGTYAGSQFNNVVFTNSGGYPDPKYELLSDMLIANTIFLDEGVVKTGDNIVLIQNTATDAIQTHGETSYIDGNLRRYITSGSYDFPVGTTSDYQLVNVDISSTSGGLTYLDAKFTSTSEERPPEGLEVNGSEITEFLNSGYWTVSPDAGSAEYDITLVSRGHSNGGFETAQHAVFKRSGLGDWESLGSHDNATQSGSESGPIYATRSSLTGFSDFIIGKNDIPFPLPVELTSFTAECHGDEVILSWQTESELNNDGFSVEKSNNGVDFYQITFMPGCGNCNNLSNYELVDDEIDENAYYRLKQIDYDGAFSYSDIISSSCGANRNDILSSINEGMLLIDFSSCNKNQYQIELYDNSGKMVFRNLIPDDYNQNYNFYLPSLSSGIYYLNIYNKNEFYSQKVNINIF
ncbi:MAG: T9SS type A sorting domain-containing protein [Bacteroidales bacterium]|nr:T9SS type A sorting domain-containing protein [Bacteroidales bacterium]